MRRRSSAQATSRNRRRARARRLRYASDTEPGIRRRRVGKGFSYRAPDGTRVCDPAVLARIRALAIPPAYGDVWICADARGHLQATGRDARGRKQYRYHADWRDWRDARKFRRLLRFGARLPALRAALRRDIARDGLPREKVMAIMARVMMATSMRVGSPEYARTNHSYGLTTLRSRHVVFRRDGRALFRFPGKGGKPWETPLADRRLVRLVKQCARLPGRALFQYQDAEGVHAAGARQFNDYLRATMGERFSAKDFRTWAGTLTVTALLARTPVPTRGGERARRAVVRDAIAVAADQLGNTAAICRRAYVCPRVLEGWRTGLLQRVVPSDAPPHSRRLEKSALRFLERCMDDDHGRGGKAARRTT